MVPAPSRPIHRPLNRGLYLTRSTRTILKPSSGTAKCLDIRPHQEGRPHFRTTEGLGVDHFPRDLRDDGRYQSRAGQKRGGVAWVKKSWS